MKKTCYILFQKIRENIAAMDKSRRFYYFADSFAYGYYFKQCGAAAVVKKLQ
jgi:hypothetical protein